MITPLVEHPNLTYDFDIIGLVYNRLAQQYRGHDFGAYLAIHVSNPLLLADLMAMHAYQLTLETKLRAVLANQES